MSRSLLLVAVVLVSTMARAADQPNVLFLICDDLNCDLGCYDHPLVQSPNIDRLAQRGVRFDHAYCQYPLCGPSRASFMAGLYPDQTLIKGNAIYIRDRLPNVTTMSQMFRDAGYFATRIGKIYHYDVPRHIGTGGHDDPYSWNLTINPRGRDKDEEDKIFSLKGPGMFGAWLSWLAAEGTDEEQTDGIAATEAVHALEQYARQGRSFFLAVGLYRPHTPYVAPKKYFDMHPREKIVVPTVPPGYLYTIPTPAMRTIRSKKEQIDLPDETARKAIQAYYASISFADAQIGRILEALETTGLAENTIVVFTSDHGYHMGEHGHYQKTTLYENATRVPLIMAGPGIAEGRVAASMAEMVDFYPTLGELAGIKVPEFVTGVSLAEALRDPSQKIRNAALTEFAGGYSIRTDRYRFTEWGIDGKEGRELYDHESDPAEMRNLADEPDQQAKVGELSKLLRARIPAAKEPPRNIRQIQIDLKRGVRNRHS